MQSEWVPDTSRRERQRQNTHSTRTKVGSWQGGLQISQFDRFEAIAVVERTNFTDDGANVTDSVITQ